VRRVKNIAVIMRVVTSEEAEAAAGKSKFSCSSSTEIL
jgi:hypothetical protein